MKKYNISHERIYGLDEKEFLKECVARLKIIVLEKHSRSKFVGLAFNAITNRSKGTNRIVNPLLLDDAPMLLDKVMAQFMTEGESNSALIVR